MVSEIDMTTPLENNVPPHPEQPLSLSSPSTNQSTMNICLLGGTYFIGRRIAAMLVAHRHEVCLVNRGRQPPVHGTTHLRADRSNVDELAQALADRSFDAIIDVSGQRPEHVVNLVEALPLLAPRIIFISSGAVYTGEKPPFGEDSPTGEGIWGAYGLAKLACEEIWEKAASASGASLLSLRPPYLYGLGNPLDR